MNSDRPAIGDMPAIGELPADKNIFVLNPASGRRKHGNEILRQIRDAADRVGADFDVYFTKEPGDARRYIREYCENMAKIPATAGKAATPAPEESPASTALEGAPATPAPAKKAATPTPEESPAEADIADRNTVRFFGCGGDGTVNELVNGAYGFEGVEIGVIPHGTGNDYIRNYGDPGAFLDIERQLLGESRHSDLIHYEAECNGRVIEGLCANMFNIGFDSHVVETTENVKRFPLVSGSMAYLASVFITLAKKRETSLTVEYPDGTRYDDNVLLLSVANGCFCGGGIKGVPKSVLDDGLMDVSLVRGGVSRSFFVRLFPKYQKGTHLEDPRIQGVIYYRQEPELTVTAKGNDLTLCVDGEISKQKKVAFKMIPKAIKFIVPKGL